MLAITALALSACVTYTSYPDHAQLCNTGSKEPWIDQSITLDTSDGPVTVKYIINDVKKNLNIYNDGRNYWVTFIVYKNRRIDITYDPSSAYVMTSGGKLYAEPQLYLHKPEDKLRPGNQTINNLSDVPQGTYTFIKFPISVPEPDAQWLFDFGYLSIDGTRVKLPDLKLCKVSGKSEFKRYKGAW